MKRVDFNSLPQHVRERLTDALNGESSIQTVAERLETSSGVRMLMAGGLAAFSAFILYMMYTSNFGRLSDGVKQEYLALFFYVVFTAVILWAVLYVGRRLMLKRAYPFMPGVYLLPYQCVRAQGDKLEILFRNEIINLQAGGPVNPMDLDGQSTLIVSWKGAQQERFPMDYDLAQDAYQKLARYSEIEHFAKHEGDDEQLRALDPFFDMTEEDWRKASEGGKKMGGGPFASGVPLPLRKAGITAMVLAMAAGPALWFQRNQASQQELYDKLEAQSRTSSLDWERYLEVADYEAEKIRTDFLPAAAFREARGIQGLRDFLDQYPDSVHVEEAEETLAGHYDAAVANMKSRLRESPDPAVFESVEHLIRYLQTNETTQVRVRFRPPSASELETADERLKELYAADSMAIHIAAIAPHFTDENNRNRESFIVNMLQQGFGRVFQDDMLALNQGGRLQPREEEGPPPEDFSEPTLVVEYEILPSGELYTLDRSPNEAFVGIEVLFDVYLVTPPLPDGTRQEPLDLEFLVEPPAEFNIDYTVYQDQYGLDPVDVGPSSGHVYNVMAQNAFGGLGERVLEAFFEPEKALEREAVGMEALERGADLWGAPGTDLSGAGWAGPDATVANVRGGVMGGIMAVKSRFQE